MAPPLQNLPLLLLCLNFCMYAIVVGIGAWSINRAIDHSFIIEKGFVLPAHFSPIYFPMGNAATGFFVIFSLIAGVVGVASAISGLNHICYWGMDSLPAAAVGGTIAWSLTILAMGFAWKQIDLTHRNSRLMTMEAFITILSATQLFYIALIHGGAVEARGTKSKEATGKTSAEARG
ncbi:membrane protein PM19L-like isoform X2 [Salvia splendens]|uniref:membrane protein PM19L-like isoform X2 n=1 Tax=Salvia splendens TaxID=180675 RepID=UPI001C2612B1|nr:membrane protein PM19L-like isoform X2 [Salvia splendens]